jgi:serine/threonine protein kinase
MLTTEKLFRGDTEFALMEKVRKAEIAPPSKYNRRVTPELDAVVLKALARDVTDRYQSADAFAADLSKLLVSYKFNPRELQEFIRGLFRADYAKEVEEMAACRASYSPPAPVAAELPTPTPVPHHRPDTPTSPNAMTDPSVGGAPVLAEPTPGSGDERRGIWSRIKSKFSK